MKTIEIKTLLFFFFVLNSCSQEKFGQKRIESAGIGRPVKTFDLQRCTAMTPIEPLVDILVVVDNSSSTNTITTGLKTELAKLVDKIPMQYNYHLMLAPLVAPATETNLTSFQVVVDNVDNLQNVTATNIVDIDSVSSSFFTTPAQSHQYEFGFKRVKNIIDANRANGVFRDESYKLVILISNGDDNERQQINGQFINPPVDSIFLNYLDEYKKYSKKYFLEVAANPAASTAGLMKSEEFRFLSVVAHSNCNNFTQATRYKQMSKYLYEYNGSGNDRYQDSYDLCTLSIEQVFAAVGESISYIADGHIYDYWPINTASGSAQIEETEITVQKLIGGNKVSVPKSSTDGWEYVGYTTQKIRRGTESNPNIANDPLLRAEEVTAHMIKLNGSAVIVYPECILAKTQTPYEYFGYVAIPRKPKVSSIKLNIRGQSVPENSTNGWSYLGYRESLNIKVPGPTNAPILPALNQTGYFLKLNGNNYLYSHGDEFNISYRADD